MRHAGACESLAERLADFAAVADHQRAHLGIFGIGKIAIEKRTYMVSERFDFTRRKTAAMPDDLECRRAERSFWRGQNFWRSHGRVDSIARHLTCEVELARVAVVVREMNSRAQPNFVAESEIAAAQHCYTHSPAHRAKGLILFRRSRDRDVQAFAIGLALGLAKQPAFNRDGR